MIALDASVLVAHLYPLDAHHEAATGLLLDAVDERLLVHTLTLAEVLVGGVKIGQGAEMLADLKMAGIMLASRDDDEPLRLAELRATTGLKLPDCCVLDVAVSNGVPQRVTVAGEPEFATCPATSSMAPGEIVPMPTLPVLSIIIRLVIVDDPFGTVSKKIEDP